VLPHIAVCCHILQCVATYCSVLPHIAVCCSMLQCVAACCSVLQHVAVCSRMLQCVAACCSVLQHVAACCSILQYVAGCHSTLQYARSTYVYICALQGGAELAMGWLRFVGSLKRNISFAEHSLFYRALLQKRPIILRSLLIVATPYVYMCVAGRCRACYVLWGGYG